MKSNIDYFKISINQKETLDRRYMSLEISESLDEMVETTKEIKELLITIKRLNMQNLDASEFYNQLRPLVLSELGSKNEFNGFINACDSAISTIAANPETFKTIVDLYLENRTISDHTPREWVQALVDKGSQRSLGTIGENKVIELAERAGFIKANNTTDFFSNKYSVIKFSKTIKNRIDSDVVFGSQKKDLDIILKSRNNYCFIEAKHIKEGGGAQDKQIKELIGLLNVPLQDNLKILAFMDGVYSNVLLVFTDKEILEPQNIINRVRSTKTITQRYEIVSTLYKRKNAYWVNTAGLIEFLNDFISN